MCLLWQRIQFQKGERQDVFSFLWKQASMGKSWWDEEPGIPRTVVGMRYRPARIMCLGEGQVPAVVRKAWEVLNKGVLS
jgi:hypothetical protein